TPFRGLSGERRNYAPSSRAHGSPNPQRQGATMSEDIDVPDGLSADAEDMFRDVLEQHPEMAAHQFHSLIQAARLVSLADEMESQVQGAYLVPGYKGQPVANGLLTETRLARASAVTALKS